MINEILIIIGAGVLFYALFLFLSFRKKEKIEFGILSKKITFINNIFHLLILFFFIGYCLIITLIYSSAQNGTLVIILSQVLFWGAIFVIITIILLMIMLETIVKTKLNQIDPLTMLYNKMSGDAKVREILLYQQKPIYLAILDLDNFKKINDIYGHLVGDEILVETAKIIKTTLKDKDIGCRFGGDEFIIVLVDKKEDEARNILESIKDLMAPLSDKYPESHMSVSIGASYGIGQGAGGSVTAKGLMQNADKALYHVKKNGKNGVHFYSETKYIYD